MTTRDRIIESTQQLLWERGYVAVSPKDIQERAGAGQGSMYHHFEGKADLAAVAIERSAAAFREGAEQRLAEPGTSLERIRGYLLRSRDALKGCQIGRLCQDPQIVSASQLRQPLATTFEWLHLRLKGIIEEGQRNGEIRREIDADDVAAVLIAAIQGGYVLASAARSSTPFDRSIRGALSFLELARVSQARRRRKRTQKRRTAS
jgi:TetR/AcrR family transcriptional repressor of nem operon